MASALAYALEVPVIGIHHLEGHLLSPLLAADPPAFPFVALLVSGGHTQLMRVDGVGRYRLLGETVDDAAGEAFDKTAQILGLGYPGGPAVSRLADQGRPGRLKLPRPMLNSADLDFSFSGLKTAVLLAARRHDLNDLQAAPIWLGPSRTRSWKCWRPRRWPRWRRPASSDWWLRVEWARTDNFASGCDAAALATGYQVYYPEPELCTDNGAMIALAGALRLAHAPAAARAFSVRPRWELDEVEPG